MELAQATAEGCVSRHWNFDNDTNVHRASAPLKVSKWLTTVVISGGVCPTSGVSSSSIGADVVD